jgi:2-haloacid dehalogenase
MGGESVGPQILRRVVMSEKKRTNDLGEPTLKRREFLAVGGATIAATTLGGAPAVGDAGVGLLGRTVPNERAQQALANVEAMTFDVFGTVVDWRTSIIREGQMLGREKGFELDWPAFADAWRRGYGPAMNRVRTGELPWLKIDQLHRMILDDIVVEFGLPEMTEEETDHLNRVWHRLIPWPDTVRGLWQLKANYTLVTLSNGNVSLLANMAKNAGLPWDVVLSAELSGHYKTDPEVYIKAAELLSLPHEKVMMVAAHKGDLRAAAALGFKTGYVPRPLEYGPDRDIDITPDPSFDVNATDFMDLAAQL